MTGSTGPDEFDDVNEAVGAEWEDETTPYERIRDVISRVHTPVSTDAVADTARTSPKTARKHLNTLADEGFVTTDTGENGGTTYRRSPESLVVEQAADIREHVSTEELITRVSEMREHISDFQAEYGVESPEELLVERTNQTLSEAAATHDDLDPETLQEWQTTRRNLAFANAALSIATAERFVGDESRPNGSTLAQ
ncbi:Rrf2 family transcriptional regulator [Haloterrigena sp. SYSU A558-1]|uniref:Rrf2 family transcriptional regulator n=1 Tax=Haloterrigena gelatinilytica TaxID=2741724 RepID=A0ABX2L9R1_9EURY|nr:Rrf2 family transcriptional regulator [Haloterrigena gelatinilytica]NUC73000.1 Rrf2 family transcriptional regulator [Haloterrigena gelatinilytica]